MRKRESKGARPGQRDTHGAKQTDTETHTQTHVNAGGKEDSEEEHETLEFDSYTFLHTQKRHVFVNTQRDIYKHRKSLYTHTQETNINTERN